MNLKKHLVTFKKAFLLVAVLSVSQFINAQTTVVGWDGSTFSYQGFDNTAQIGTNPYANTGITANSGVSYIQTFGGVSPCTASDAYGDQNQIIFNLNPGTGWINGSGTKGYSFSFVSTGYSSLKFSGKFGGTTIASFKGARDFKLQYSLNNSTWTDVSNATVQAAGNTGATTSAIFNSMPEVTLPSDCDNKSIVYLRVIMTSDFSPDGQTATAAGQTYIDDFKVTGTGSASPPVVLTCPSNTTTVACQTQASVNSAFATWLATASGTGGTNGVLTNNNTGAPSACGGSTSVTFTYTSTTAPTTTTCQATFTVSATPTVVLTCPTNTTAAACQTQAAVNSSFATWLATASANGGCNGVLTNNNTGAPTASGGSTTVTFTYTSSCAPLTTTCQATFSVAASPTVVLTCPTNTTSAACQTQAAVNSSFATWLSTASASGGCNGVLTNNNTGAPSASGGSTTVTFTYTSSTAPLTTTCQATFTVTAPPTVVLTCPTNTTVAACQTQAAVNSSFATWLSNASASGGCNGVLTNNNTGAPSACGGSTTVTFTYTSTTAPTTTTCQATFTVTATPTVVLTCPTNSTVAACQTQAAVNSSFATWLATASANGGCNGVLTNNNTGAPSACGGSTTVTFTYTSSCAPTTTTCQATFTVATAPTVVLTCPTNTTAASCQTQLAVNSSFAIWLATASASGGCNGVLTNNNTGAPSAFGGSTTVTFTYTSTCAPLTTTCQATYIVAADTTPPTVEKGMISNTYQNVAAAEAAALSATSATDNCSGALTETVSTEGICGSVVISVTTKDIALNTTVVTYNTTITIPTPTITAGSATTFCVGGNVTLTSSAASSYLWSNGARTRSITVNASGTLTLTVSDGICTSASSNETRVIVNPLATTPIITAASTVNFCTGGSVTLTSTPSTTYKWSTGATTQSIVVSNSGLYSVVVNNGTCNSLASIARRVTVNPIPKTPTITAVGSTSFCAGKSVTLTSSSASGNVWSTGANTQSITVTTGGSYSVAVTSLGCTSETSISTTVTVKAVPVRPTITASGTTTLCTDGNVTFTSSSATGNLWSNGETTPSITVSRAGTYSVSTINEGCSSTPSLGKTVIVNTAPTSPTISVVGSTNLVNGGSVLLTSSYATSNTWSTGAKTRSITVTTPGTYSVSFASATCTSAPSQSVTVTQNSNPE